MGLGLHLRRWALAPAALLAGAAMIVAPTSAAAQMSDSEAVDARAIIITSLSFFRAENLNFGRIIPATTAGTVVVAPDGTRTASAGITLVGNGQQPARFAGRGTYNQMVRIRVSSGTINLTGPGATMTVTNFMLGSTPNNTELSTNWGQFRIGSTNGIFYFPIGGTLHVNARQAAGTYSGTFTVTLEYL